MEQVGGNRQISTLEAIVEWAEHLPTWQSDAVRKLLAQGEVTEKDKLELLEMLKRLNGLGDPKIHGPQPNPIKKGQTSGVPVTASKIVLKAMKIISNVNAIPDNSNLPFGHKGLTVIYGQNASGKSGYARVLKRACNSRDTSEQILPNAFVQVVASPAKASFKISINGGEDKVIAWEDGKESDTVLSNICVFDHKCARVIVDENNEMTYLPYGADVFEKLVSLMKYLRGQLENEKPRTQKLEYTDIPLNTDAGKFINSISYKTSLEEIEQASHWEEENDAAFTDLNKRIAEAEAHDPLKQAKRLRNLKVRIDTLVESIRIVETSLSNVEAKNLQNTLGNLSKCEKALAVASKVTLANEPLPGAGEDVWQKLYNAAKMYSIERAYVKCDFPVIDAGSLCVLCMQPLSEDAKARMLRFKDFMEKTIKKEYDAAVAKLDATKRSLAGLGIPSPDLYMDAIGEVESRDNDLAKELQVHLSEVASRQVVMVKAATERKILEVTDYRPFPIEGLTRISDALEKEATEVEKSAVPGTLLKMKAQQTELAAKKLLYTRRDSIKTYVGQLRTAKKYDQCIAETDFRSITDKGKDILTKTLTPQLQEALLEELGALNARHIPLRLKATGREGETLHKLELMGCPSSVKANLTEILSEGEQHVVAVAGFLAELRVSNPLCPIVFDDPVCSLDHLYRGKIAKRLAREATSRQVIIFTHDIAFLLELEATTAELGGYFFYQMVLREGGTPGYCTEKKPWHTMSVKERITYLDSKLKELSNIHKTDKKQYNEQAARLYGLLRESWEATVEEVLLKGVIIRHGSEVKTLLLRYVTVTDEDYRTIFFGMGKCSEWMTGHDKARSLDENRPAPVEVSLDIQSLRNFVTSVNKRNEDIEKQRKESVKAQVATAG